MVAKAVAAAKDIFVARWFGRSDALDAFLIAYLLPSFFISLAMGALASAFTPVFVATREREGADETQQLFSRVLLLSATVLTALIILLAFFAPYFLRFLASGFSAQKLYLARELLYVLLPFVWFGGIAIFAASVLNAGERFALPAVTPLLTPLMVIMFMKIGAERFGAFSLAGGVLAGSFFEAALLWRALKSHGLRPRLGWDGIDSRMRIVLAQFAPMLAATFFSSFTTVVDQSMAAMLPAGSVAALSYANKVTQGLLAVGATGLSTAALSYFSKMAAYGDWNGCRHTLKRYSVLIALVTIPVTVGVMMFSQPLVRLLFQRGAFTVSDTTLVSRVQFCYVIQLPFFICTTLYVRFLSSIRCNHLLMYGSAISLVLDIVLNLVLMRVWGVAGIALATSLVHVVLFLFTGILVMRVLAQQRFSASVPLQSQEARR